MKILILFTTIVLILMIVLIIRLMIIKSNLKRMKDELKKTREDQYNKHLNVTLIDRDLENLAMEINDNIDYQKSLKFQAIQTKKELEQSISDIAHDLITPLTVIKGNIKMLETENLSDKGREYLDISSRKAETLKRMVDEFFEMSVLESESGVVTFSKIDIISFLTDFIIENETIIRKNNLEPNISFPEEAIFIKADYDLLSRVFNNLISNVIKYAKDSFDLSVVKDDKSAHIRVSNHISDTSSIEVEHIFDRTYRADKARSEGSAGLGLYIVKLLVEKQGGSIIAYIEGDELVFDMSFLCEAKNL